MESRYDAVARWYAEFTGDWSPVCLDYLPDYVDGQRVLDLACGNGVLSRLVAARGAQVTAIDRSVPMLEQADLVDGVTYLPGDATTTTWWDGHPFHGVVCNMALMDIDDLDAALATIVTVAQIGSWVLLSLLHPCFPGRPDTATLSSWPPGPRLLVGGVVDHRQRRCARGHVGAYHRTLSTYLNAILRAGLELVEIIEPPADRPRFLVLRCRRR